MQIVRWLAVEHIYSPVIIIERFSKTCKAQIVISIRVHFISGFGTLGWLWSWAHMRMEKELRLLRDEMEKERRVKEALVEERDTWKDMFLKALKSMEGLEKEIAQNESEIANLKSQLQAAASEKVIFLLHYSS